MKLKKIGGGLKNLFNPSRPQYVDDAWKQLTAHEQFAIRRLSFSSRVIVSARTWDEAYADLIRNRDGDVPSDPTEAYTALTPQEKTIVKISMMRNSSRRVFTWADTAEFYRQVAEERDLASQPIVNQREVTSHANAASTPSTQSRLDRIA